MVFYFIGPNTGHWPKARLVLPKYSVFFPKELKTTTCFAQVFLKSLVKNGFLFEVWRFSKNIEEIISKEEDPEQNELIEKLPEIKETRDKIVNHVKDMQPLLEKFQGYIDKFNDYNASGK